MGNTLAGTTELLNCSLGIKPSPVTLERSTSITEDKFLQHHPIWRAPGILLESIEESLLKSPSTLIAARSLTLAFLSWVWRSQIISGSPRRGVNAHELHVFRRCNPHCNLVVLSVDSTDGPIPRHFRSKTSLSISLTLSTKLSTETLSGKDGFRRDSDLK